MLDTIIITIFILLMVVLVKLMIFGVFEPLFEPTEPTDMAFMMNPYLGLPYMFWLFLGIGIMLGLPIHGFTLVTVDSHNVSKTQNVIKKKKRKR